MLITKLLSQKSARHYPLVFEVAGLFAHEAEAKAVMGKNPVLENARKTPGKRIYVLAPFESFCELVPEKKNRHDDKAIMVLVNGNCIGYVPKENQEEVQKRIKAKQKTSVKLLGGNYKVFEEGEWVTYKGSIHGTVTICQ